MTVKRTLILIFLLWANIGAYAAERMPDPVSPEPEAGAYDDTLFGDWRGTREAMRQRGYDWEIVYKLDLLGKVAAPASKTYGVDNLDVKLAFDGEKLAGLEGSSALIYILSNRGGKPASVDDHSAGLDNIETPEGANTTKLYQAWIQQAFLGGDISILAGLYDLNSEFYATESSGIFIQPVYGIGAEMADTGKNGPSIFPTAAFGIRAKAAHAGYYIQTATLDGVPGDPNNPHGTHVQFNKGDGALNIVEGGMPLSGADDAHDNKLALGMWRYTARFDDLLDPAVKRISRGYYVLLDKVLRYKSGSRDADINSFVRAGRADGDTTQCDLSWSAGLVFTGVLPGRDRDQLGVAYALERNSQKWRIYSGTPVVSEKSVELTYQYHVMHGLMLQPEAQYLITGKDPAQDKSWWAGIRLEFSL